MAARRRAGAEPPPGEAVERRETQQVEQEAACLRDGDSRFQGILRPDPGDPHREGPHVGVQRRGPVVQHAPALADAGIVREEALDIMLDRPLAPEHRGGHLQVVAAIPGDERQVAAADPDDRADRVADAEDREPCLGMPGQPGCQHQAGHEHRRADRQVPADEDELGGPAEPGQDRDLVELVGDRVEGRRDPPVSDVEPRGQDRRRRPRAGPARPLAAWIAASPMSPGGPETACDRGEGIDHGFFALSMASRRARNSLPGFHSGYCGSWATA